MSPAVSIIIPCYNRQELVGEAIESALRQGADCEVIVVDDGSTDASWPVIESFGDRIRAFRKENGGVSAARNLGIREAKGRFVRFLDSDDRIPSGTVAALLAAAAELPDRSIAFGDAIVIGDKGADVEHITYGYAEVAPPGPVPPGTVAATVMSPWLPLFPTEALREHGGFDERFSLAEDHELALRLLIGGYSFVRVPAVVCEVREHGGGRLSRGQGVEGFRRLLAIFGHMERLLAGAAPTLRLEIGPALGRMVWTAGRDAARAGHKAEAQELFALASKLGGRRAWTGARSARLLYHLMAPYQAERLLSAAKRVLR